MSSATDLKSAAVFAYPSFALFLSGLAFAFFSFFISLIWATTRLDAAGEYLTKVEALATKAKAEGRSPEFGEVWKQRPVIYTMSAVIGVGNMAVLATSGFFFFIGSAAILEGVGKLACASTIGQRACAVGPSFPFSMVKGGVGDPNVVTVTGMSSTSTQAAEHWVKALKVVPVDPDNVVDSIFFSQWVRLSETDRYGEFTACYLEVSSFLAGDSLVYDRRAEAERLIAFSAANTRGIDVRPAGLEVRAFLKREGEFVDSQYFLINADAGGVISIGPLEENRQGVSAYLASGGRGVVAIVDSNVTDECLDMILRADIEIATRADPPVTP